jgi:hypothetical protein
MRVLKAVDGRDSISRPSIKCHAPPQASPSCSHLIRMHIRKRRIGLASVRARHPKGIGLSSASSASSVQGSAVRIAYTLMCPAAHRHERLLGPGERRYRNVQQSGDPWRSIPIAHPSLDTCWEGITAGAWSIRRLRPSGLIRAGHSGHIARMTRSHCSSMPRKRRGREYSTLPN